MLQLNVGLCLFDVVSFLFVVDLMVYLFVLCWLFGFDFVAFV